MGSGYKMWVLGMRIAGKVCTGFLERVVGLYGAVIGRVER